MFFGHIGYSGGQYHKTMQKSGDETKKTNVNNGLEEFFCVAQLMSHDHIFGTTSRWQRYSPKQKGAKNDTFFGIILNYTQ